MGFLGSSKSNSTGRRRAYSGSGSLAKSIYSPSSEPMMNLRYFTEFAVYLQFASIWKRMGLTSLGQSVYVCLCICFHLHFLNSQNNTTFCTFSGYTYINFSPITIRHMYSERLIYFFSENVICKLVGLTIFEIFKVRKQLD